MDLFGLPLDVRVRHMSTGVRAQLSLTLAHGRPPKLLVLDEPTRCLDAAQRFRYLQALVEDCMEDGRTVLLSSHDLYQMERMADQRNHHCVRQGRAGGGLDSIKESEKRRAHRRPYLGRSPVRAARGQEGHCRCCRFFWCTLAEERMLSSTPSGSWAGVGGFDVIDQSLEEIFLSYAE